MKKIVGFAAVVLFIVCCVSCTDKEPKTKTYYTYFDTVISVTSYADESSESFEKNCTQIEALLDKYNRLFDIYHEYSGINNICTINSNAGKAVKVDSEIIELLELSRQYYEVTGGELNIMMGSVLKLWHEAINETKTLPSKESLEHAAKHCDFNQLVVDETHCTVMLKDEESSIDVGAIAKGFATEKIARLLMSEGVDSYVINAGGNVRMIGRKTKDSDWSVAIRNPEKNGSDYAMVLKLSNTSCVTSGVYERNTEINGKSYHHIIDRDTLYPSEHCISVSVICNDSTEADALSTALFCMGYEDGRKLAESIDGVEVIWILSDGSVKTTEGIGKYVR